MAKKEWAIGVDLGGTKIDVGLVDGQGHLKNRILIKTRVKDGPQAIIDDIVKTIHELLQKEQLDSVKTVGVGVAGQIEKNSGNVYFAPNLEWKNFPLQEKLTQALQLPVAVINDVRAAAWGEWLYGAGKGCDDLICIFFGTGIGGGVVSGGQMLTGATNSAGEIGHITIDLHGPKCACGNYGCFEALAGGRSIGMYAQELASKQTRNAKVLIEIAGGDIANISGGHVFEAYRRGDPFSKKIIDHAKNAYIAGVAGLANAFNPQRVILGGGIIQGTPELIEVVRQGIPSRGLKIATEHIQIVEAALQGDAGVIGAAAFACSYLDHKKGA